MSKSGWILGLVLGLMGSWAFGGTSETNGNHAAACDPCSPGIYNGVSKAPQNEPSTVVTHPASSPANIGK